MGYEIKPVTVDDVREMSEINVRALSADILWSAMKGSASYEDELAFAMARNLPRLGPGHELGACQTWKVVNADGKMLGWAGLGIPHSLSKEESAKIAVNVPMPSGSNGVACSFFFTRIMSSLEGRYDPSRDCQRQQLMVDPIYQRQGIGRLLTQKCSEEADKLGVATWVRARPHAASLFVREGYKVIERIDFDLGDFGAAGGKTSQFVMKREPCAKSEPGGKLEMGF